MKIGKKDEIEAVGVIALICLFPGSFLMFYDVLKASV